MYMCIFPSTCLSNTHNKHHPRAISTPLRVQAHDTIQYYQPPPPLNDRRWFVFSRAVSLSPLYPGDKVVHVDASAGTVVAESGVVLESLETALNEHGMTVPLDLGAKGKCQIGGNVSTNAGVRSHSIILPQFTFPSLFFLLPVRSQRLLNVAHIRL